MMDMDYIISEVLRIGTAASLILILGGAILLFMNGGSDGFTIAQIAASNSSINTSGFTIHGMMNGIREYQGLDIILVGIVVLIATPIVRVLMSIFLFMFEKNRLYTAITLIVFIDLMVAVFVIPHLIAH